MSGTWLRIAGGAGLAAAAAALSYPWLFRRPCLTWGATPEEAARELPGDAAGDQGTAQRLAGGRGLPDPAAAVRT